MQLEQQHPLLQNQSLAIGLAALCSSLCYLLGVMLPVAGALLVFISPFPLFVVALTIGFRPVVLASCVALVGISCVGVLSLTLHFMLSVVAGVLWHSYVLKSKMKQKAQKMFLGWFLLGLVSVALNASDPALIQNLTKAVNLFYDIQLSKMQIEGVENIRDDMLKVIRLVPAALAIFWLGALSLMYKSAVTFSRKTLKVTHIQKKNFYKNIPEGCFYLLLIACLGCMLSSPDLKLFFVNALVFSLFPFLNLGNTQIQNWCKKLPSGRFMLIVFYVLCFLMIALLVVVALIGVGVFLKTYQFPFSRPNIKNM